MEEETTTEASYDLSTYNTKTRKGLVTLEELNEKVLAGTGKVAETHERKNKSCFDNYKAKLACNQVK